MIPPEAENSKFEIRNKSELVKRGMIETKLKQAELFRTLFVGDLVIVSQFELRISNFPFAISA